MRSGGLREGIGLARADGPVPHMRASRVGRRPGTSADIAAVWYNGLGQGGGSAGE